MAVQTSQIFNSESQFCVCPPNRPRSRDKFFDFLFRAIIDKYDTNREFFNGFFRVPRIGHEKVFHDGENSLGNTPLLIRRRTTNRTSPLG